MRKIKQCLLFFLCLTAAFTGFYHIYSRMSVFGPMPGVVSASAGSDTAVYPCGFPIGIYLKTKGVMVIQTAQIPDADGKMCEPAAGSIVSGDYILSINGEKIGSKEELQEKLNRYGDNPVTLLIEREGTEFSLSIRAVRGKDGNYRLGIWVKDDIQGIGTMTYLTSDGRFGALGHPISDTDTGKMVHARTGGLYQAQIKMIIRGSSGTPGSFSGIICYDRSTCLGEIETNSANGIFGTVSQDYLAKLQALEPCAVGQKGEVTCGEAVLRCTIGSETKDYSIMILNLKAGSGSDKGLLFQVTDQELLEKTGGIIQGMSGSPIIQNGKLVGAVTHVFVQDSTRGYGIYIEDMMGD